MKRKIVGISIFALLIIMVSCKKNDNELLKNDPSPITSIFKSLDPEILKACIIRNDTLKAKQIEGMLANRIADYYLENGGVDLRREMKNNTTQIVSFGLFMTEVERGRQHLLRTGKHSSPFQNYMPPKINPVPAYSTGYSSELPPIDPESGISVNAFNCFWTAVTGLFEIGAAYKIYADLISGSLSLTTAIAGLKFALGKVAWGITVALTIYSIGECMDWWFIVPYDEDSVTSITERDVFSSNPRLPLDTTGFGGDSIIFVP